MTKKIIAVAAAITMSFILVASPSQASSHRGSAIATARVTTHSAVGPGLCCDF